MTLEFIRILVWPTFAVVTLVLVLTFLRRWFPARTPAAQPPVSRLQVPDDPERFSQSLQDAEWLASLESEPPPDPVVHLAQAVRVNPSTFREAAQQVRESFRAGRVVILDLAGTEETIAVRLVDFCSAMTLTARGTLHRLSSTVLLLTPRIA